ncbi:hypothetical protein FIBSPDRAFT_954446 [Athelia psychrophila]|uniref:Hydrophobin n=1 Tax=Athelia psychrophila TaxID=1759441 RepID=A0A166J4M8_9AGAM|nr:hypothetical protein FIBSPDRAFT_954446 [Fibularhizoctonia sp. CBS 109695]
MLSSRIIPFLFLVATFGLFAFAAPTSPVVESSLAAHHNTRTCTTSECNGADILTIVANLQATIAVSLCSLDGETDPGVFVGEIIAAIGAAVTLLGQVVVTVSIAGSDVNAIVNIVASIIVAIATCVSKYGLIGSLPLSLQFDLALSSLVTAVVKLIPGINALLGAALNTSLDLLQTVKFVLTLVACLL